MCRPPLGQNCVLSQQEKLHSRRSKNCAASVVRTAYPPKQKLCSRSYIVTDTKIAQPPKLKLHKRRGKIYTAKVDGRRSKNCTNAEAKSAQPPKQNYTTAEIRLHDRRRTRERFPCPKWTTSEAQPPSKKNCTASGTKPLKQKKQNQKLRNRRSKNCITSEAKELFFQEIPASPTNPDD